jgi:hypothetical protein
LIELGVHTHTHVAFAERVDDFRRDLSTSIDTVRSRFGISQPTFSFPFGLTTPELAAAAEQVGVSCALTSKPERIESTSNVFHWGRFNASDLDTPATLTAKLNGWYSPVNNVLRRIKRPVAAIAPGAIGALTTLPLATSVPATTTAGHRVGSGTNNLSTEVDAEG